MPFPTAKRDEIRLTMRFSIERRQREIVVNSQHIERIAIRDGSRVDRPLVEWLEENCLARRDRDRSCSIGFYRRSNCAENRRGKRSGSMARSSRRRSICARRANLGSNPRRDPDLHSDFDSDSIRAIRTRLDDSQFNASTDPQQNRPLGRHSKLRLGAGSRNPRESRRTDHFIDRASRCGILRRRNPRARAIVFPSLERSMTISRDEN